MVLHVAEEDLKPYYRPLKEKEKVECIITVLKSIKVTFGLRVLFEVKEHNTAAFTIVGNGDQPVDRETTRTILEYLRGQLCDPASASKYGPSKIQFSSQKKTSSQKVMEEKFSNLTISNVEIHDMEEETKYGTPRKQFSGQQKASSQKEIEEKSSNLTIANVETHDMQKESGPRELHQFACFKCKHSWWRKVLKKKPVSKCRGGKCGTEKYDPVPRNKEFGIGRYHCSKCDRFFFAHCEFTDILDCRICKTPCTSPKIHPKWRKRMRKVNPERRLNPNAEEYRPPTVDRSFRATGGQYEPPRADRSFRATGGQYEPLKADRSFRATGGQPGPPRADRSFRATGEPGEVLPISSSGPSAIPTHSSYKPEQVKGAMFVPRRCKRKHAFNPSTPHKSTGSTVTNSESYDGSTHDCDLDYDDDIDDSKPYPRRFECQECGNKYTVRCTMGNTAQCYECGSENCNTENPPLGPASADAIDRMTNKRHSCSACPKDGRGKCPNLPQYRQH